MQKKSLIKQNILQYLDFIGITQYKFYKETGITRGILTQDNGMSEENTTKFLAYYTDVNPEWLLTGKGEMLRQKEAPIVPIVNEKDSYIIELQKDKIRSLEKELQNQRQEIEQLKKELSSVPVVKRGDNYI